MTPASLLDEAVLGAPRLRIDPRRDLVVVAPHPDDEVIGFGGAIYDHRAAGGRVTVVAITDGEAFDAAAMSTERARAAAIRRREQLEALATLGVDAPTVVRLGVPDGGVSSSIAEVAGALRALLEGYASGIEPLVVTPWRADHHPDHEATTCAVRRAAGEVLEVPIWSWHHRFEREPAWQELFVVPISRAARDAKRRALARHHSQLRALPGGRPPILSPEFVADFDRAAEVVVQ